MRFAWADGKAPEGGVRGIWLWRAHGGDERAIWVATVAVGMVLRSLTGQGVAVSFVVVASVVLGVLLLGSRLVWRA